MTLEERMQNAIKRLREVAEIYAEDGALNTADERINMAELLERILNEHREESKQ